MREHRAMPLTPPGRMPASIPPYCMQRLLATTGGIATVVEPIARGVIGVRIYATLIPGVGNHG